MLDFHDVLVKCRLLLQSLNGVFINKTKIRPSTPVALEDSAEICFGSLMPLNELRYTLVTSCGDPHMLLKVGAREQRDTANLSGAPGESFTEAEESECQVVEKSAPSSSGSQGSTSGSSPSEALAPPTKRPCLEKDVSLGTGVNSPGVSEAGSGPSTADEGSSQVHKPVMSPWSKPMENAVDPSVTTPNCSQSQEVDPDSDTPLVSQQPPPPAPLSVSTTTPTLLVSPVSNLETPASAIDELFSDGTVERDFDEIVSDVIFGEDGSVLPSTGPSSAGAATMERAANLDGASLQVQAARDDMQRERQKYLSSIEALKSELASKDKLLAEKSEQEKEVEERKRESEGVIDSMQEELTCVICQELFVQAHTLSCAHSFCKNCIEEWMKSKRECPVCRKTLSTVPVRSLVLDNAIDRMVEKMGPAAMEERKKLKDLRASRETLAKVGLLSAPRQPNGRGGGGGGGGSSGSGGSSGTQTGTSGGRAGGSSGTQTGTGDGHGGGSSGTQTGTGGHGGTQTSTSGGCGSGGGGRGGGGGGGGGQSGGGRRFGGRYQYYDESDDYDDYDDEESDSDDDSDSGLEGAYYGGYGRCFNCGESTL